MIQPTRTEVTRSFPVLGFTVRTGFAPAWFEVAIATDPALFEASAHSRRTTATFYSSRSQGPLPAERGEAVYLVPQAVLDRFAGQEHLYYALAAYHQPGVTAPQLLTPPGPAAPSVYVSRSFTGPSRRLTLRPNRRGGINDRDGAYVDESPATLTWGGDDAVAGSSEPVAGTVPSAPAATARNGGAKPAAPAATAAPATPAATTPAAPAHAAALDLGYDDGFGAMPIQHALAAEAGSDAAADADDSTHDIGGPIPDVGDAVGAQALTITSPEYPGATRFEPANSGNYRVKSGTRTINRIVIHITDGGSNINGTISWFKNPAARVSAHYVVGQNGDVVQMVANNDIAWHAGSANGDSIGIEHVASKQRNIWPTDAEYCASAMLVHWLCQQFNIPMDRDHVLGHSEADPHTTHSGCPNSVWDWERYMPMVVSGQCPADAAAQSLGATRALDMDGGVAGGPSDAGLPGGVVTPPPDPVPPAQVRISTVHIWVKAFIKPARIDGPPGWHCFSGDDRDFSTDPNASARVTSELWITGLGTASPSVRQRSHCDPSHHVACDGSEEYSHDTGSASRCSFGQLQYDVANARGTVSYVMAANNPLVPGSPDIDITGTFSIDAVNGTVSFNGLVDQYPWFEAYADGVQIFTASPLPGKDALNLIGDANKPASGTAHLGAPAAAQALAALSAPVHDPRHHHHHHANGNGNGHSHAALAPGHIAHAHALSGEQSYDIDWPDVPLYAQTTGNNCWAAAGAMVQSWHDTTSVPIVETDPTSYEDCRRQYNLVAEPLQSNPPERFRQLLTTYGPLWVCADQPFSNGPGFHAVVITGMFSDGAPDGSDTCLRIADPWDRAGGVDPPPHSGTHNTGSRYILTFPRFLREFEAAVRNPNNDWTWVRLMHNADNAGRTPSMGRGAAAQSLDWQPVKVHHVAPRGPAATATRAQAVPAAVVPIASVIVGASMTRILNNEGDITWELEQVQGLQHVSDNPANQGSAPFQTAVTTVNGPHAATVFGLDEIYADFEVTWEWNGRSLGNVRIANIHANDAIGAGLHVSAAVRHEANAFQRAGVADSFAAIHIQFSYQFSAKLQDNFIALTDITLYGDGTISRTFRWTQ